MSLTFGLPSSSTYTFSGISDTIITLTGPNSPFTVWDQPGSVEPKPTADNDTNSPLLFQVYSKNLIQASQVFKAALTGGWKESSPGDVVNSNGEYMINTKGWDPEALSITLNAIHGRTKAIPSTISLKMLCKIAVLVDYYKLHDALSFFASVWIKTLHDSLPICYKRDLILWICVSSMFGNVTILESVTKIAIKESPEKLQTLGLPIPNKISVNYHREKLFKQLTNLLDKVKEDLLEDIGGCSFECRSLLLSALTKQMYNRGYSYLGTTYSRVSASDTITKMGELHSPSKDWHKPSLRKCNTCKISLPGLLAGPLEEIANSICRLGLEDSWDGMEYGKLKKEERA
ncbi:hypothetical protein B0T25DRAFT_570347 [Lasiosphaeria hispida]|uniref:BTB domain-containing protein n=1 Tax=Lasiosphaeria hispida TaxID=260671 RepID=A0AAJ0HF79_9PEZI|nr:hypothetical protein B0T25DRAFT_570347 [Lasiosphaeria hispida]